MISICHICNNYVSSLVHRNIVEKLSFEETVSSQYVFIPIKDLSQENLNKLDNARVLFEYAYCNFNILRYFPLLKVLTISTVFLIKTRSKSFDHILAHNMWTDGIPALLSNIFFKTNFSLVIRNTDLNVFITKLIHYRWLMKLQISRSNTLIFISESYRKNMEDNFKELYLKANKIKVISNAVDDFWIENNILTDTEKVIREDVLLYVGGFNKNKNLKGIVLSAIKSKEKFPGLKLLLVGGTSDELREITGIDNIPFFIEVLGRVNSKYDLLNLYRSAKVFMMPSFFETFGLVYIEALLQGCSIIHSKGQGIDGLIKHESISPVNPNSIDEMSTTIDYLLNNFKQNGLDNEFYEYLIENFNWHKVANDYLGSITQ